MTQSVPSWVVAALQRALAKAPADRFNPVALFAEALGPRGSTAAPPALAKPWSRTRTALLAVTAAIVVVAVLILGTGLWPFGSRSAEHPRTAIAVLPFQNLSAEGPYAYFAAGLHDKLLPQLAKIAALSVRAQASTSMAASRASRQTLAAHAAEANPRHLVACGGNDAGFEPVAGAQPGDAPAAPRKQLGPPPAPDRHARRFPPP